MIHKATLLLIVLASVAMSSEGILTSGPIETCIGNVILTAATQNERGSLSGNSGQQWDVSVAGVTIGQIWGHRSEMRIENLPSEHQFRVWAYIRSSGRSGQIGYYVITTGEIAEFVSIEINPGDSGTDLGNAVYRSIFAESIPFHVVPQQGDGPGTQAESGDP